MNKISAAIAVIWLAALIPLGLSSGQQAPDPPAQEKQEKQEKESPPLVAQCQTTNKNFVKGQNVEINCVFLFKENVNLDLNSFKKITVKNFSVIEFSATDPV